MFDIAGDVVWSAQIDAYGELRDVQGSNRACPFRWPGQYEDFETGLYYNRFRYYDPGAGEYVSQDPIGLKGGFALHAYPLDPLIETDKSGLAPWKFDPSKDVDMTGGRGTFRDALDEAFRRTGQPREEFAVTKWEKNVYGKTAPAEWSHPSGAIVNVDDPTIVPTREGPQTPHVGYQAPGKRRAGGRKRGHILVDSVPVTRPGLGCT
jgi:RHS repeat-associated protein